MEGMMTEELRGKAMELTRMALEHKGFEVHSPRQHLGQEAPDLVAWDPEENQLALVAVNVGMIGDEGHRSEEPSLERFERMAVSCLADLIEHESLRVTECSVVLDVADVMFMSNMQALLCYRKDVLRTAKAA